MKKKGEIVCSSMAFYGLVSTQGTMRLMIDELTEWFNKCLCPIQKTYISGEGWPERWLSFERARKKVLDRAESIKGICLNCLLPGPIDYVMKSKLKAEISFGKNEFSWATIVARPGIADIPGSNAIIIASKIVSIFRPGYGIGFQMPLARGPSFYGIALPYGVDSNEEVRQEMDRIQNWGRVGMRKQVYNRGILRSVYPWNFLNNSQLTAKIGKHDLQTWINSDSSRGQLTPMENGITLWEVDDTQIAPVLLEVESAGLIFNETEFPRSTTIA